MGRDGRRQKNCSSEGVNTSALYPHGQDTGDSGGVGGPTTYFRRFCEEIWDNREGGSSRCHGGDRL